jgi:hypothetical protein
VRRAVRALRPRLAADLAPRGPSLRAMSDRAWRAVMRWVWETAEGLPGPDGMPPTNLDRLGVAHFLAKLRGEYAPAKVAVKAEGIEPEVLVAFAALSGPVEGEDDPLDLPHVAATAPRLVGGA